MTKTRSVLSRFLYAVISILALNYHVTLSPDNAEEMQVRMLLLILFVLLTYILSHQKTPSPERENTKEKNEISRWLS